MRITQYDSLSELADADILLGVDVSDITQGAQGSTKKIAISQVRDFSLVNAPVTARPRRYRPTWASTFQSGHGFTDPLGGGTIANDTSDFIIGEQSVSIDNASGTNAALDKSGFSIDLTDKALCLWVKVDRFDAGSYLAVYAADTAFANYKAWEVVRETDASPWFREGEWVFITLPWANGTSTGSPNRANIQRLRIRMFTSGKFHINGIGSVSTGVSEVPGGVVSITFDDGYDDFLLAAQRSLTPKGLTATAFCVPSLIGTTNFMTEAQLLELRNVHGWDIQAHGEDVYTGMTASELRAEWSSTKSWFAERGLGRPDHLAYVGGQTNEAVIDVAREYFSTARTIAGRQEETWPPAMPHRIRALSSISSFSGGTSVASVQSAIDRVVADGGWLILVFHRVVTTPASTLDVSWTDLDSILDYINSSGVDVKTIAEAAAALA